MQPENFSEFTQKAMTAYLNQHPSSGEFYKSTLSSKDAAILRVLMKKRDGFCDFLCNQITYNIMINRQNADQIFKEFLIKLDDTNNATKELLHFQDTHVLEFS